MNRAPSHAETDVVVGGEVKVLYKGAEIIILDEPTSVLTPQGIEGLFRAIRYLTEQ